MSEPQLSRDMYRDIKNQVLTRKIVRMLKLSDVCINIVKLL